MTEHHATEHRTGNSVPVHRPLSVWAASVPSSAPTRPPRPGTLVVNDGDERADARRLPKFAHGWRRTAIPLGADRFALGLVHARTGERVVELGSTAAPVLISDAGLRVLAHLEDHWPNASLDEAQQGVLGGESVEVRRLVLARLADEGRPPAALFHLLPWHLVDRLAGALSTALLGQDALDTGPVIALRNWFSPAGSRFTAALEQLDEGVRAHDRGLIRVAAASLCTRLGALDADRLPAGTRAALAELADVLARDDRFLGHAAAVAAARLRGGHAAPSRDPATVMATHLADAADGPSGIRRERTEFERPPFTVRLTVSATGRCTVSARATLTTDERDRLAREYGAVLLPVRISGQDGARRYWLILQVTSSSDGGPLGLSGAISTRLPEGDFVAADVDGAPLGLAEAGLLDVEEVERSVRAVTAYGAHQQWEHVAASLPANHPLRGVIDRASQ
ncbi:hypothetical protein BCL80_1259 [Streptomyces avidinii]|uniref:hypothetical protein n=1 Tax=Streptomyces TaxID=1883 RepID=UPI000BCDDEE2|nr:hypothetical protein BCL80_1259 [Streptomyces avidinii]SNX81240.1 hypothetical protein SAMN05421860_1243 [Streptomyces microflavus]